MSDEPERRCVATLRDLKALRDVVDERDRRYEERFVAQERATAIYQEHADAWRENANEWRSAMGDREREFLSKSMGRVIALLSAIAILIAVAERFVK